MSHAGMSPLFAEAKETEPGRYEAHLEFQMAGDWVILLHVTLPDGKKAGTTDRREGRPTRELGKLLNPSSIPALETPESLPFDLMRVPGLGHLFRWRYARPVLQAPLLVLSLVMILHGLFGPTLAPKNLATTLSWLHFRGVLVLVLLCAGNFFCLACPFMLVRQAARRFFKPRFTWPRALRNKWLSVGLFVLILFTYELFDLWSSPWWTAWLIVAYFLSRARGGWIFQARFILQVRLPDRTVQLCGFHAFAVRSESPRAGRLHALPYQRLYSRPAGASLGSGDDPRLRTGSVSAQQSRQHGLHFLPGLRSCLPARQHWHLEPYAGERIDGGSQSDQGSDTSRAARTWQHWPSYSRLARC